MMALLEKSPFTTCTTTDLYNSVEVDMELLDALFYDGLANNIIVTDENIKTEDVEPCCPSPRRRTNGVSKSGKNKKCINCNISAARTPQLREGPDGPQTLCNACGVAYRKYGYEGLKCRVQKVSQPRSKCKKY